MNNISIESRNNEIHLKLSQTKKSNLAIRFLGGLALCICLIPILLILILEVKVSFVTFLIIFVSCLVSAYLGKLYFWNKYGVENFFISKEKIKIICDYKLFKDTIGEYEFENIETLLYQDNKLIYAELKAKELCKNKYSRIVFKVDEQYIESINELPVSKILDIAKRLRQL